MFPKIDVLEGVLDGRTFCDERKRKSPLKDRGISRKQKYRFEVGS